MSENNNTNYDVIVIGAGPAGAIASALLVQKGYSVLVLEKEQFPRFSIGESLLPHCMQFIEEANMLDAVVEAGFQFKNGAAFQCDGKYRDFDFTDKSSDGPGTTFQVQRAKFDKVLADSAEEQGVEIRYLHTITSVDVSEDKPLIGYVDSENGEGAVRAKFLLDGSGFGRVLPRMLDLERPSNFPVRQSIFTHVTDNISAEWFDRNKILVTVHPKHRDIWFWLIPFSNGVCSLGVVAEPDVFRRYSGSEKEILQAMIAEDPSLSSLLTDAVFDQELRTITGYSANVKTLHGNRFALLGNAGEFLDPIFSSGVTIAMRSASLAAELVDKQLQGHTVDWEDEFSIPLKQGVETFKTFVTGWYNEKFHDIIFHDKQLDRVKTLICSVLAGYAWDKK